MAANINPSIQAAYESLLNSSGQERADSYLASMQPYTQAAPAPVAAPVSDQAVTSWLQSNPGASDAIIAGAMNQYGVTPDQMARVTGLDTGAVQARYDTGLSDFAAQAQPAYFQQNPDVAAAYANRANDPNLASTVNMTPDQFAAMHFQNYGTTEQRAAPTTSYEQMVRDAYGSIGRTGIGTEASNIDQAGFDNWVAALQSGSINPADLSNTFKSSVADYLAANPEDQYSTYVTNYLQETKNPEIAGIQQLYQDVLGRDADPSGLGTWYKQFGSEISPEERAEFEKSAKTELDSRVQGLYTDFLGRDADAEGVDYWRNQFGSTIDDTEREQFRQSAAAEINKQFGVTDPAAEPTTEGILSGFKYANEAGLNEDKLKKTLGEDVFDTYKTGFADYAKTGIANILADDKLSFDEARTAVKFGRDYGYDAQKLADLTGTDKRVFDAIYKNYDDTTNRIVDSVLDAEDVKTNDDKVVKAFQLQKQFGFTDEDLAKAADFTPEQVKGFLDPVRNYESERKTLFGNTDTTSAEARKFIEDAKKNGAVSKLYNEDLGNLDTKIAELEDRWKTFEGVDPLHAQRVYDQIGQQRTALGDKYYQGTFGDPMKMAATLAKKGIDTLADIGQKDKFETEKAEVRYTTADGMPIQEIGDKFYVAEEFGDGGTQYREVPKDQIKTTYGRNEFVQDGELGYSQFVPLTEEEQATLKDGKYEKLLGKVAYDKDTGKEIAGLDGTIEAEKSGKWYNKKRNELNVGFTDSGVPVLYTTKEKTGFGAALQQALPIISMVLPFVLPGVGAALSSGLASAGGSALAAGSLANSALTQGIISGTLGSLGGQDFGKSFLSGAINPVINTGIGSLLPTGMDPNIARAVTGAGSGVIKGALQGGDIGDLLQQGILSGATNYGLGEVTKGLNLTPQQLNFATGIALPLIQGQKVNPMNVIGTLAQSGQQAQKAQP